MSIKLKLLLSNTIMLIVPLLCMILTALLMIYANVGDMKDIHQFERNKASWLEEQQQERLLKELKRTGLRDPELFTQNDYLLELDSELGNVQAGILVRISGQTRFLSDQINIPSLLNAIDKYIQNDEVEPEVRVKAHERLYVFNRVNIFLSNSKSGQVIVVRMINPLVDLARDFFPLLFISMLVVFVLTHTVLSFIISHSIIQPLQRLRQSADLIKEGDLSSPVPVAGRNEIGQLGIALEEMRKQLQHSIGTLLQYEENRKELISSITHDLKTPLTAIKGYVEGVRDGVADTPEKMDRYIRTIYTRADEMDQLIEELLLYSKLDLKKMPFNFEHVNLLSFLQDCVEDIQLSMEKKGFVIEERIELEPDTIIYADRDKLKRVITNIVQNCVKYSDKAEKRIGLYARCEGTSVILEFEDNGMGIEAEALPHIFERFYRAEQSRNSRTGGSGLGLAIAKEIVEGHHGRIEAASTIGQGTTITISLPVTR